MRVTVTIVDHGLLLDACLGHGHVDLNGAVLSRGGGQGGDFQGIKRLARVAIGDGGKMF